MDYKFDIIMRDQVPLNIYLCGKNDENDWKKINYFKFENGLECVIGSNRYLSAKEAINSIKSQLDYIIDINNPDELQEYFFDNFDNYITYEYGVVKKVPFLTSHSKMLAIIQKETFSF
jgi:hypothetical protein